MRSIIGYKTPPHFRSLTDKVRALFAKYSGVGGMWDFADISKLFANSNGTGVVSAVNDPVGYVTDINTGSYPAIQTTLGKRPAWNGSGITPDGVDDSLSTAPIDFTACDKMVTGMGYEKLDISERVQIELGNINYQLGTCLLLSGNGGSAYNQYSQATGNIGRNHAQRSTFSTSRPNEYGAHIGRHSIPSALSEVWWNGTKGIDGIGDKGSGNFGNWPLYLLARSNTGNYSNTPARRAIVLGIPVAQPQMSDDDIELIRQWLMEGV